MVSGQPVDIRDDVLEYVREHGPCRQETIYNSDIASWSRVRKEVSELVEMGALRRRPSIEPKTSPWLWLPEEQSDPLADAAAIERFQA